MSRFCGSVSVFAALVFLLVASVITASLRSARIAGAEFLAKSSLAMALDSTFANYNSELLKKYGILMFDESFKKEQPDENSLNKMISDLCDVNLHPSKLSPIYGGTDLYGITDNMIAITDIKRATDAGGLLFMDSAVSYEKYNKPINLAAEYLGINDAEKQADTASAINNKIIDCTNSIIKVEEDTSKLICTLDGIEVPKSGLVLSDKLKPVNFFFKKFCPINPTAESLAITNQTVYKAVSKVIAAPSEVIRDYVSECESENGSPNKSHLVKLLNNLMKTREYASDSLNIILSIDSNVKNYKKDVDSLIDFVESKKDELDTEFFQGVYKDAKELKKYDTIYVKDIIDTVRASEVLTSDIAILDGVISILHDVIDNGGDKATEIPKKLRGALSLFEGYSYEGLNIDYSLLLAGGGNDDKVKDTDKELKKGLLKLVMPSDKAVSKNTVKKSGHASSVCNPDVASEYFSDTSFAIRKEKNIIFTEYVFDSFGSYDKPKEDLPLKYGAEYVYAGNESDEENLADVASSIALLRSGVNMLYLFTDSEKKESAYLIASTMVGMYHIEPLVRLLQFTVMYLWAYAEGIADTRILFNEGKVKPLKTKDDWQLSLDNLFANAFTGDGKSKNSSGLDYKDFLRFLIFSEDECKKSARSMDLIEFDLNKGEQKNFLMKNQIYGLSAQLSYKLSGLNYSFSESSVYNYK